MIEAKGLTKFFGQNKAVDNVTFIVEKGEVLGFLGPNAAGKSTTMRMLTGYLPASSGAAIICGHDVGSDSFLARKKIGYLPENAPVYEDMTVTGFLDFCAQIRGLFGKAGKKAVDRTIEKCFLESVRHQTVGTLSKGFNQRVCFAQSIIHDPQCLILDEPTDGLDPNQKHEVRTMIREMGREKAIILSTHILEEVDAVCTRAIIIAQGRIVADDTPEGLRARSEKNGALKVVVAANKDVDPVSGIKDIKGVKKVELMGNLDEQIEFYVYPEKNAHGLPDRIMSRMAEMGCGVESISVEKGRLDEVFRNITMTAP